MAKSREKEEIIPPQNKTRFFSERAKNRLAKCFKITRADIPEEKMGIRIEDDVVIQKTGVPFNLMRNIPIEIEEIEELMNS